MDPGISLVALAHGASSTASVDAVLDEAEAAGADVLKPGRETFRGSDAGDFADPDGHPGRSPGTPSSR